MSEERTKYKVVDTEQEYHACKKLLIKEKFPDQEFVFPTIIAYQGRKLIGFLATSPDPDIILGGPLVMDTRKHRAWTAMKLISLYEEALFNIGVKRYIFWIDPSRSGLTRGLKKYFTELKPYATEGDKEFYVRNLEDGRFGQSSRSDSGREGTTEESGGVASASA